MFLKKQFLVLGTLIFLGSSLVASAFVEPWQYWIKKPLKVPTVVKVTLSDSTASAEVTVTGRTTPIQGTSTFYIDAAFTPLQSFPIQVKRTDAALGQITASVEIVPYEAQQLPVKEGTKRQPYRVRLDQVETTSKTLTLLPNSTAKCEVVVNMDRGLRPISMLRADAPWSQDDDSVGMKAPGDGCLPELGPGLSATASMGAIRWAVSLGKLWNGQSAGMIRLTESRLSADIYSAKCLYYTPMSIDLSEVKVLTTDSGQLRQILVPQAFVDIQSTNTPTEQCVIKFYLRSQIGAYDSEHNVYSISDDNPFVIWRLTNPDTVGTTRQVNFVEERDFVGGVAGRTSVSTVRFDTSTWSLITGAGADTTTLTRAVDISGKTRKETVQIASSAGTAYKACEQYQSFDWGWELVSVVTDPDGVKLTHRFVYNDLPDPWATSAYGRLRDHFFPGGRWERTYYPGESSSFHMSMLGSGTSVITPLEDGPENPDLANASNAKECVNFFDAQSGLWVQTTIFPDGTYGWVINEAKGQDAAPSTVPNVTFTWRQGGPEFHQYLAQYDRPGHYTHNMQIAAMHSDQRAEYYEYAKGTFDNQNGFAINEVNGSDIAQTITYGWGQMPIEDISRLWFQILNDHYPEDQSCLYGQIPNNHSAPSPITLTIGKSTRDWIIRRGGNIIFKQISAMQSISGQDPVFSAFEKHVYTYDSLGHLTNEVWIDVNNSNIKRTLYEASWLGANGKDSELLQWEINDLGEKTSYAYDSLKRVTETRHWGVSQRGSYLAQSDISTNRTFDAVGRVLRQTVTGGPLQRIQITAYDISGRVSSITGADGVRTNYDYPDPLTVIEKHPAEIEKYPGGITIIRTSYLDGQPRSVTGSGVVNEYYDYSVAADPYPALSYEFMNFTYSLYEMNMPGAETRTRYGQADSKRWMKKVYNQTGRLLAERTPGFDSTTECVTVYENFFDLPVIKQVTIGDNQTYNETYVYNNYGAMVQTDSGDYSSGSGVHSSGSDSRYEYDGTCWYLNNYNWQKLDKGYITNSMRSRLSGFKSSSTIFDCTITDPDTNVTRVTITLDRANKTVTAVTNVPQSTIAITSVTINGLLQTLNSQTIATPSSYYYDVLGRQISVKNPLGYWSGVSIDPATGWTAAYTNFDGKVTQYSYYSVTEGNAGRVKCETGPTGKKTYHDYTARGELAHTWGDVPYPEERLYSDYGELVTLHTYRGGSGWTGATWPSSTDTSNPSTTTWVYDPATGLLVSKLDNSNVGQTYSYNWAHVLATTKSAEGMTTTYSFDEFGHLLSKTYSGENNITPAVEFGAYADWFGFVPGSFYTLGGQPMAVRDESGIYVFSYDFAGRLTNCTCVSGAVPDITGVPVSVSSHFNPVYGRDSASVQGANLNVNTCYGYEAASGRLASVASGDCIAAYSYLPNSDLLKTTACSYGTIPVVTTTRTWDYGFRLRSISSVASTATVSAHTYGYDGLNRRQQDVMEDGSSWNYGYNDRNELVSGSRQWSDASYVAGQQFAYTFDSIGNRLTATENGRTEIYQPNDLNEYSTRTRRIPDTVDIIGSAKASATVTINGLPTSRHGDYFDCPVNLGTVASATCLPVVSATSFGQNTTTKTRHLLVPPSQQIFQYDLDGNLKSDGLWTYTWDAENRLRSISNVQTEGLSGGNRFKVDFAYDYMGRRSKKTVSVATSDNQSWTQVNTYYFIYDIAVDQMNTGSWNLLAILDGNATPLRSFAWGQDVSGQLTGAGGIGGLLWVSDVSTLGQASTHFAVYDGNGNVNALVNAANRATTARYEYSPFGQLLRATGPMATANPFRFSTKFWDDETGLVYYGYRYYSPTLGRWIGRDPSKEDGGMNLYAFVLNNPYGNIDPDGQGVWSTLAKGTTWAALLKTIGALATGHEIPADVKFVSKMLQERTQIREALKKVGQSKKRSGGISGGPGPFPEDETRVYDSQGRLTSVVMGAVGLGLVAMEAKAYALDGAISNVTGTEALSGESGEMFKNIDRGDQGFADLSAINAALELSGGAGEAAVIAVGVYFQAGDAYGSGQ